jgi:hypothetical protein
MEQSKLFPEQATHPTNKIKSEMINWRDLNHDNSRDKRADETNGAK